MVNMKNTGSENNYHIINCITQMIGIYMERSIQSIRLIQTQMILLVKLNNTNSNDVSN